MYCTFKEDDAARLREYRTRMTMKGKKIAELFEPSVTTPLVDQLPSTDYIGKMKNTSLDKIKFVL